MEIDVKMQSARPPNRRLFMLVLWDTLDALLYKKIMGEKMKIDMKTLKKEMKERDRAWKKALKPLGKIEKLSDEKLLEALRKNYEELLFGKEPTNRWEASCRAFTLMEECKRRKLEYEHLLDPLTEKYLDE
jgi:hypothetical protein